MKPSVERILLPLDGTADSESILGFLPGLLSKPDSEVLVIQAYSFMSTLFDLPIDFGPGITLEESEGRDSARYVASTVELLKGRGINARGLVHLGSSVDVILETARRERASMIAMSTHGRSGLSHLLHGNVTEKVLRRASIPFFVVHAPASASEKLLPPRSPLRGWLKKILLPVSRSSFSIGILSSALDLAGRSGARILLLHVAESKGPVPAVQKILDRAIAECKGKKVPAESLILVGNPEDQILKAARYEKANLIAMTTHGVQPGTAGPLGSVTTSVLREARVPMLVVRALPEGARLDASAKEMSRTSKAR